MCNDWQFNERVCAIKGERHTKFEWAKWIARQNNKLKTIAGERERELERRQKERDGKEKRVESW